MTYPTCIDTDTGVIAKANVTDSGLRKGLKNGREKVLHWYASYHIMLGSKGGREGGGGREEKGRGKEGREGGGGREERGRGKEGRGV